MYHSIKMNKKFVKWDKSAGDNTSTEQTIINNTRLNIASKKSSTLMAISYADIGRNEGVVDPKLSSADDLEHICKVCEGEKNDLKIEFVEHEVRECFNSCDLNENDYIDLMSIKSAYTEFGINVNAKDCRAIIEEFDTTGYGHINFPDFHRGMHDTFDGETSNEVLLMVFNMMDEHGRGYIGVDEITKQFHKLGTIIAPDEAVDAVAKIDKNGVGVIDFAQFKTYYLEIDKFKQFSSNLKKNEAS